MGVCQRSLRLLILNKSLVGDVWFVEWLLGGVIYFKWWLQGLLKCVYPACSFAMCQRSLRLLLLNRCQVGGCLVCGVAAGGSDTFQVVVAKLFLSVSILHVALLCANGPFACYY